MSCEFISWLLQAVLQKVVCLFLSSITIVEHSMYAGSELQQDVNMTECRFFSMPARIYDAENCFEAFLQLKKCLALLLLSAGCVREMT